MMEKDTAMHALAILKASDSVSWNRPVTSCIQVSGESLEKFKAITPKLLSAFIIESQALGGTILDRFWVVFSQCHPRLAENVTNLLHTPFLSLDRSETLLFDGINRDLVNFDPIFKMAAELFTYLGVAFMNPGRRQSGSDTPFSVSDAMSMETDTLMEIATEEGFGIRKQAALTTLTFRRDGMSCPLTSASFENENGVIPNLVHLIPHSVSDNPDTIKYLTMFAGAATRDFVLQHLNDLGNLMNLQADAHMAYDNLRWGIEARVVNETVTYIYRRIPQSTTAGPGPGYIRFRDGDSITFGGGPEARQLGTGPLPILCNLQLAVARALRTSGAAELIAQIIEEGDVSDLAHVYVASPAFCDVLTAQLLASGRALIY